MVYAEICREEGFGFSHLDCQRRNQYRGVRGMLPSKNFRKCYDYYRAYIFIQGLDLPTYFFIYFISASMLID